MVCLRNICINTLHKGDNNNNNNNNDDDDDDDNNNNFWLKQFTATHRHIAAIFNKLIEEDQIPEWLTAGITFLIPKNENTEYPKNYRPVTCLPTMYKLITSVISRRMQKYMDDENLIPKEQKGCY